MGDYEKALQSFDLRDKNFEGRYYMAKAYYALALAKYGKVDEAKLIIEDVDGKIGELNLRPDHEEVIRDTIEEVRGYLQG